MVMPPSGIAAGSAMGSASRQRQKIVLSGFATISDGSASTDQYIGRI